VPTCGRVASAGTRGEFRHLLLSRERPRFRIGHNEDKPSVLRVKYVVERLNGVPTKCFSEWVCPEHSGYAGYKAYQWWRSRERESSVPPKTVEEALSRVEELRKPAVVTVQQDGRYWRVVTAEFGEVKDTGDAFFEESRVNL
jgi:hypothetical protein